MEKIPNEKLQELIIKKQSERRKEPSFRITELAIKIISKSGVREFENLTEAEKNQILLRANEVDYTDFTSIQAIGNLRQSPILRKTAGIVNEFGLYDIETFSQAILQLLDVGKDGRPIKKRNSVNLNIQSTEVLLRKQKIGVERRLKAYESMLLDMEKWLAELEIEQIAISILERKAKEDKYSLERLKNRAETLQMQRTANMQALSGIMNSIKGDEKILSEIEELLSVIIPLYKEAVKLTNKH